MGRSDEARPRYSVIRHLEAYYPPDLGHVVADLDPLGHGGVVNNKAVNDRPSRESKNRSLEIISKTKCNHR
jgi:hypothetical protein